MELDPAQPVLVGNFINFMKKLIITKARNLESTKFILFFPCFRPFVMHLSFLVPACPRIGYYSFPQTLTTGKRSLYLTIWLIKRKVN
jgi:hypothetical protein